MRCPNDLTTRRSPLGKDWWKLVLYTLLPGSRSDGPPSASNPSSKFRQAVGRESRQGRVPLRVVDTDMLTEPKHPNSKGKEAPDPVLAYSGALTWLDLPQPWLDGMHTL
ncbi:hypothetical protein CYMTET_51989 [Cymbomonas tetramitiformis]|uniref:Uncharacterized protein n=1 Tax=Cymbomonas tetramitiformis TaxID=36881 RepID=A0AAE0ERJ1_9CHLO|nr:hypothetical protein CYMTET_51989 [Cymbomonas tetramitiformis]